MSAVVNQPITPEGRRAALQALAACPTHSIHVKSQVSCPADPVECLISGFMSCRSCRVFDLWRSNTRCMSEYHTACHTSLLCRPGLHEGAPISRHACKMPTCCVAISGAGRSVGCAARLPASNCLRECLPLRLPRREQLWCDLLVRAPPWRQCHDGLAALPPWPGQAAQGQLDLLSPVCKSTLRFHYRIVCLPESRVRRL